MAFIHSLNTRLMSVVKGQYQLATVTDRTTQDGRPYKKLRIADCTGTIPVYAWENSGRLALIPDSTPSHVGLSLHVRYLNNAVVGDLRDIQTLDVHEVHNAAALFPLANCPQLARPALQQLVGLVDTLEGRVQEFVTRVLLDPRVGSHFLRCKASRRHHHAACGGLLIHSMEVAHLAEATARAMAMNELEVSMIQVAALMHDMGKIRTVGSGGARPVDWRVVRHEMQTNRILEPHLEWLRTKEPEVACAIEYVLDFLAIPASARGYARWVGADIVAHADRVSAASDNKKRYEDFLRVTGIAPRHTNRAPAACASPNE